MDTSRLKTPEDFAEALFDSTQNLIDKRLAPQRAELFEARRQIAALEARVEGADQLICGLEMRLATLEARRLRAVDE